MWLIVTEKFNTARRIANILFKDVKSVREGRITYFRADDTAVVGLRGHVIQLDFSEEYNSWTGVPVTSLIRGEIVKKVTERGIVKILEKLGREADRVTIATDFDREGELIGVEAVEIIRRVNPDVKVDRVRFSAITPAEIKKAFSNPSDVDISLASAAEARQVIDLIWGATLTRFISLSSGRLGRNFLSVGRVQSPTLRIIVDRELEIERFKPEKYYEVHAVFRKNGEKFSAKHEKRFKDKNEAESVFSRIGDTGTVISVEKRISEERPPSPFNTTEFLAVASRFMSPSRAMNVAEELYMNGFISYPRTDNTVYPPSINLRRVLKTLSDGEFGDYAEKILRREKIVPTRGRVKSEDHPPIYPTSPAKKSDLKEEQWKIYELVVRRFLATLSEKAKWKRMNAVIDCNGERFPVKGSELLEMGWREIYPYSKAKEVRVPDLEKGDVLEVVSKKVVEKETTPPSRYTTGNLIKLMERLGLGTKSTRHEILKKLFSRTYVYGNPLRPTETAKTVVNILSSFAEVITKPDMTKKLEEEMDQIAEGKLEKEKVIEDSRRILEEIFEAVNAEKLSQRLRHDLSKENRIGECPECGGELVIRKGKNGRFIGCSSYPECTFTLPLPKTGTIIVTGRKCEKHGIKELRVRKKKSTWKLGCPYCNYIEWKSKQK